HTRIHKHTYQHAFLTHSHINTTSHTLVLGHRSYFMSSERSAVMGDSECVCVECVLLWGWGCGGTRERKHPQQHTLYHSNTHFNTATHTLSQQHTLYHSNTHFNTATHTLTQQHTLYPQPSEITLYHSNTHCNTAPHT